MGMRFNHVVQCTSCAAAHFKLSGSLHYCCTCPNKNIISTCALAIFTACIVGAEAKSIRMRVDISGEDNQDEGRFRNLKSERGFAEDEERSELSLKLINALKSFFGFKTKLTSSQIAAKLSKPELTMRQYYSRPRVRKLRARFPRPNSRLLRPRASRKSLATFQRPSSRRLRPRTSRRLLATLPKVS